MHVRWKRSDRRSLERFAGGENQSRYKKGRAGVPSVTLSCAGPPFRDARQRWGRSADLDLEARRGRAEPCRSWVELGAR